MRFFCLVAVILVWAGDAAAETIPLPRPRPPQAGGPAGEQSAEQKKPAEPPPPSACFVRLREVAVIRHLPDIHQQGGCTATDVVQLEAVILPDDSKVAVEPASTFRCEMASALTDWVRDELAPSVAKGLGSPLRAVESFDSFSCRGRNNVPGAQLSEHGKANALDIRALKLVDGTMAQPTDPNIPKEFRDGMRKEACTRFKTVLGPGADGFHEEHIHVDLLERRNDYRICQWEVRLPVHRIAPSPHIVSETTPRPHAVPASIPLAAVAPEDKPPNPRSRRL